MMPIANARMYSMAPGAADAWRRLLAQVIAQSGVAMDIVAHAPPARLDTLWQRDDLGCVFMCGWPFARGGGRKTALAAPVPDADWAADRPQYHSDFIVAAESPFTRLEETFGHRFAYNARDSHSGYNAPRIHLSFFAADAPLFSEILPPQGTPLHAIRAIAEHRAELAAVDSYFLRLLHRHAPAEVANIRVVARTAPGPIPLLVANALTPAQTDAVRAALLGLHQTAPELLAELCLRRFNAVDPAAYAATCGMEQAAGNAGFADIR